MEQKSGDDRQGGTGADVRSLILSVVVFLLVIFLSPLLYDLWMALQSSSSGG